MNSFALPCATPKLSTFPHRQKKKIILYIYLLTFEFLWKTRHTVLMDELEDFFSLVRFQHRDLWKKGEPIWSPLQLLDSYLAQKTFRIEIKIPPGVFLDNSESISIGKGVIIEPGVLIQGPCIIGKESIIRHGAYLRGAVICGERCVVGHAAEIKHSILLDQAAATHFTYVGDSIVGNGANLGAGVKCANLRLDRNEVKPGMKKFGACIGDRVQIGCNCVLNPGTCIGKESIVYPLLSFGGKIAPKSRVTGSVYVSR
jgi:bifunctional UDP-N-acetylglucosamine pyrophosphorylase / glucosamine-1-phosphate N-acetyltransferase